MNLLYTLWLAGTMGVAFLVEWMDYEGFIDQLLKEDPPPPSIRNPKLAFKIFVLASWPFLIVPAAIDIFKDRS